MGTERVRFAGTLGLSLTLSMTACGQVDERAGDGVTVVAAGSTTAPMRLAVSPTRLVSRDSASAQSREQEAFDLAATDRYPTLPPDQLELARDMLASDGTDGV